MYFISGLRSPSGTTSLKDFVLLPHHLMFWRAILYLLNHNGLSISISMKSTRINPIFQDEQCCGMPVLTLERHPDWSLKQPVTEDVDHYCTWWQTTFLSIMQCIPKKVCPPKRWIIYGSPSPWSSPCIEETISWQSKTCEQPISESTIQPCSEWEVTSTLPR